MEYNWDSDLLKEAKLYTRKNFFKLYNPQEPLFNVEGGTFSPLYSKIAKDIEYLDYFSFYESYLYRLIDNYANKRYPQRSDIVKLNKQDILDLTYDFYKWLDDGMFYEFKKRFDERGTHIKFLDAKDESRSLGQTIYYPNANEIFISIYNSNDLGTVLTAIHEYAHAIWYSRFSNDYRLPGRETYRELESIFMEMLAMDYFAKFSEFKKDVKTEQAALLNSFILELEALNDKFHVFNEFLAMKAIYSRIKYQDFLMQVQNDLDITKKDIKKIFSKSADNIMPYSLGALVGFELYHIFQNDPEKALWLYKIILSKNLKTEKEMDEEIKKIGVIPSTHIETFTRKLTKH